jgi:hypothetical protein
MKANLARLHSPDAADLRHFTPLHPDQFAILVQAMIGPEGSDAHESFDIVVCTPSWLEERLRKDPIFFPRHHLLMAAFDYGELEKFISAFCAACEGPSWEALAVQLGRLGRWEFEDYVPPLDE